MLTGTKMLCNPDKSTAFILVREKISQREAEGEGKKGVSHL